MAVNWAEPSCATVTADAEPELVLVDAAWLELVAARVEDEA